MKEDIKTPTITFYDNDGKLQTGVIVKREEDLNVLEKKDFFYEIETPQRKFKNVPSGDIVGVEEDVLINEKDLPFYYKFMNKESLNINSSAIDTLLKDRKSFIVSSLLGDDIEDYSKSAEFHEKYYNQTSSLNGFTIATSYFGIKDTLVKSIPNFLKEIKDTDTYKEYFASKNQENTKENISDLRSQISSGVANFYSSGYKNLKQSVSEVTVSDFLVKSPKGVALEVGFKTLKGVGADILKGEFSNNEGEKHLDKIIKKYDDAHDLSEKNESNYHEEKSDNSLSESSDIKNIKSDTKLKRNRER